MKLWKAISNSLSNLLAVLENITQGTKELSLIYKDACNTARQEQALESNDNFKQLAKSSGLSEEGLTKIRLAM